MSGMGMHTENEAMLISENHKYTVRAVYQYIEDGISC